MTKVTYDNSKSHNTKVKEILHKVSRDSQKVKGNVKKETK